MKILAHPPFCLPPQRFRLGPLFQQMVLVLFHLTLFLLPVLNPLPGVAVLILILKLLLSDLGTELLLLFLKTSESCSTCFFRLSS